VHDTLNDSPPAARALIDSALASRIAVAAAFVAAGAFLVAALLDFNPPGLLLLAVAAISYGCGRYAGLPTGVAGALAMLAALTGLGDSVVPIVLSTAGPFVAGRALRSREQLLETLAQRKRELEIEQDALARLSVSHARARVSRELHDIVAHHLAVIVIQAGAGRMASGENGAAERFARIRQSGDQALSEMDRLVELLQPDESEMDERDRQIEVLLDQAQAAGLKLRADGLPMEKLQPQTEQLAYRVVQEGLTNVMKHAPGSKVRLRVAVEGEALEIELRDEGGEGPSSLTSAGSGFGLEGLRDRVESVGGRLDAGPEGEDGWRLRARLPTM
jgi:signal transduction histidine kinase